MPLYTGPMVVVRNERNMEEAERPQKITQGLLFGKQPCGGGTPAKELEPQPLTDLEWI
jgi:hypothetical protein